MAPFKMKGSAFYGKGNQSPMYDEKETETETHINYGMMSRDGTKIINKKGKWVSVKGDQGGQKIIADIKAKNPDAFKTMKSGDISAY